MTSTDVALRDAVDGTVAQLRDPVFKEQVALAVPEGVSPRKMLRVASTAVLENPELARPDLRPSLLQATLKAAADGLLPDGRQAAFVIFGGREPRVVYMPMIGGLRDIAAEHGWTIFTACVYENDTFEPDFETMRANHRPTRLGQDRGQIIGAYAAAQHKDGRRLLEVMDKSEIDKVRATSRSPQKGPWQDWYERQAEKTLGRRIFKKLPLDPKDRERIDRVLAATDIETGERVDLLYGNEDSPGRKGDRTPHPVETANPPSPAASGQQASGPLGGGPDAPGPDIEEADWHDSAEDVPFEGEEPPPVSDTPPAAEETEPTFTSGRYSGKTIAEVYGSGADGLSYVKWAVSSWKTQPLRGALDRFAEAHPDVKA